AAARSTFMRSRWRIGNAMRTVLAATAPCDCDRRNGTAHASGAISGTQASAFMCAEACRCTSGSSRQHAEPPRCIACAPAWKAVHTRVATKKAGHAAGIRGSRVFNRSECVRQLHRAPPHIAVSNAFADLRGLIVQRVAQLRVLEQLHHESHPGFQQQRLQLRGGKAYGAVPELTL